MALSDVEIDLKDPPFVAPPPRVCAIEMPAPISVNQTRRINWAARGKVDAWLRRANMLVMANGGMRRLTKMPGQFEVRIILDDATRIDGDNGVKIAIDYLKRLELIRDDSPKFMRRLIVEFGEAPTGCRVVLREWGAARETSPRAA